MDLSVLSNDELVEKLLQLRVSERENTLAVLYHLIELEDRRLYGELGYSSLFDYCVRALRYSDSGSGRRVAAARALRESPELAELLLSGEVTLCTIATASKGICEKRTEVCQIVGKSKREVELLVAPAVPRIRERIRPVVLELPKTPLLPQQESEQRYMISFSVTKDVYDEFERVKSLLSGKLGKNLSVEGVFKELIKKQLENKSRTVKRSLSKRTRYIPKGVKQAIRSRDGDQCTYVSPGGIRCNERRYLQFDHIEPWGLGGSSEISNLRLRCPCHNLLHAEQTYGKEFMSSFSGL